MIPDGTYSAVLDRIEDGKAALEVDVGGDLREFVVEAGALPGEAREADAVLTIEIGDGELVDVEFHLEETGSRREDVQSRFDRLSRRPPDSGENGWGQRVVGGFCF